MGVIALGIGFAIGFDNRNYSTAVADPIAAGI